MRLDQARPASDTRADCTPGSDPLDSSHGYWRCATSLPQCVGRLQAIAWRRRAVVLVPYDWVANVTGFPKYLLIASDPANSMNSSPTLRIGPPGDRRWIT